MASAAIIYQTPTESRSLRLYPQGIAVHVQLANEPNPRKGRIAYQQVDYVLLSSDHLLSLQVGSSVFSIPTQPGNGEHMETINTLLNKVR